VVPDEDLLIYTMIPVRLRTCQVFGAVARDKFVNYWVRLTKV